MVSIKTLAAALIAHGYTAAEALVLAKRTYVRDKDGKFSTGAGGGRSYQVDGKGRGYANIGDAAGAAIANALAGQKTFAMSASSTKRLTRLADKVEATHGKFVAEPLRFALRSQTRKQLKMLLGRAADRINWSKMRARRDRLTASGTRAEGEFYENPKYRPGVHGT